MEATRANAGILINLLLPMLIFSAVTTSLDASNIKSVVALVVTGVLYMIMGLAFGCIVRWLTPVPKTWKWGVLITGMLKLRNGAGGGGGGRRRANGSLLQALAAMSVICRLHLC